ncbi:exocyst complex component EXO70B1 [Andrographis paniculata]|uniref:exocyst complex component EXO70B1 n=1 Tax=Andrographis paniculata TaxID=175694 RepID=UPI0021E90A3A|nr:exocyst complex component EXO70B1 [Andrographis paniculata]
MDSEDRKSPLSNNDHDTNEQGSESDQHHNKPSPTTHNANPGEEEKSDDDVGKEHHHAHDQPAPDEHEHEQEGEPESNSQDLPPDLNQVSQEIDQFISSLSDPDHRIDPPEFLEQFFDLIEAKLDSGCHSGEAPPVKWGEEDSASFLQDVNRISSLSKALDRLRFSSDERYAVSINRVGRLLQRAMSYAEEEFRSILVDYRIHDSTPNSKHSTDQPNSLEQQSGLDHESTHPPPQSSSSEEAAAAAANNHNHNHNHNNSSGYSEGNLSGLVRLSKALVAGGYEAECCQAYLVARRNALEESMQKLGFEKHSIDDVQKMHWESLEREIGHWIRTFQQWATSDSPSERKLCDTVFSDNPSISKCLFGSLSHGVTIQLLNFAQAIALTRRATEKLFKFLDVYETLRDSFAAMDDDLLMMMPQEIGAELKAEASLIRISFGEAMILIFSDLENSIHADSGKIPVPGGAVHPLTRYTMNYLVYACEYKTTLDQVFSEHQKGGRANNSNNNNNNSSTDHRSSETTAAAPNSNNNNSNNAADDSSSSSAFQAQIIKIMDILDANLEGKSKLYKDVALSAIFMMNNGRYILKKIKGSSELKALIGDPRYRKKSSELRLYHKDYQRETWGKLLGNFHPEGLSVHGKVSKPVLKERFKSFNAMFDEIHKTQGSWVVGDEQLQSELKVSISNMVIPAYRSFLGRYGQVFTPGRQTEKYVKYQPEDLENYIEELFDGAAAGRKKS